MTKWTAESLIAFEQDIADRFNRSEIPFPVHLDGGNEERLIGYFDAYFKPGDWVCGTWRMHYKCLLAGVPEDTLRQAILEGHSITLCFPEYNIFSTALVGHVCSIAMGIAYEIKGNGGQVHCFLGDMAYRTGDFYEAHKYARGYKLNMSWVVENNNKSVTTNTSEVWGSESYKDIYAYNDVWMFDYKPTWPHQGTGKRVEF